MTILILVLVGFAVVVSATFAMMAWTRRYERAIRRRRAAWGAATVVGGNYGSGAGTYGVGGVVGYGADGGGGDSGGGGCSGAGCGGGGCGGS